MEKRHEFTVLTRTAFFTGFVLYGIVGIVAAHDMDMFGTGNPFINAFLIALLGGYAFFSILTGILFTAKWLSGKTLKTKSYFVVFWIVPAWLVMAGIFYSIPYGIYNVIQYKKEQI